MRLRAASTSLLIASALLVAPVGSAALARTSPDGPPAGPGVTKSAEAKARAAARKLEKGAKSRGSVVLGGTLVAVNPSVAAVAEVPGVSPALVAADATLTLSVHGGRYKVLRGTEVTVSVLADAKVTRDGVVGTIADVPLVAGDHVVVKSRRFDFSVISAADSETGTPTVTVTAKVNRVAAAPAEAATMGE